MTKEEAKQRLNDLRAKINDTKSHTREGDGKKNLSENEFERLSTSFQKFKDVFNALYPD